MPKLVAIGVSQAEFDELVKSKSDRVKTLEASEEAKAFSEPTFGNDYLDAKVRHSADGAGSCA